MGNKITRWNIDEINDVINMVRSGLSYKEISSLTNRSEASIRNKMNEFGEKTSLYKNKEQKYCINCDLPLDIDQLFCSRSCSATFNNKKRKKNTYCITCNKEIKTGRKYCNNICQSIHKRNIIFDRIESGDTSLYEANYKRYLIHKNGAKCMECGWEKINETTLKIPIQLDHIDGNSENNNLVNLRLLCPSCHSLTPTYGALNKGNGRKNRHK